MSLIDTTHIWVPRAKIIEVRDAVNARIGMAGEFRMRVYRPDGRMRLDTGFFRNLITNVGLDSPGGVGGYTAISVGTGNTAPANTDSTLVARVATTNTTQGTPVYAFTGTPGDIASYWSYTFTNRFGAGAAAGNLQEVGVTLTGSPFTTYSRALILDGGGSPTTLTILSDEFLDVTYRHRWYAASVSDAASTISITGSGSHDIVLRPSEMDRTSNFWQPAWMWQSGGNAVNVYNGTIGATTSGPSGAVSANSSQANASYTPGSSQRDCTSTFDLNSGNVAGGISAARFTMGTGNVSPGGGGSAAVCYQYSITPVIDKTASKILTLTHRQSWARHTI